MLFYMGFRSTENPLLVVTPRTQILHAECPKMHEKIWVNFIYFLHQDKHLSITFERRGFGIPA